MSDLEKLRTEIDGIDRELCELLRCRMMLSSQIADVKRGMSLPVRNRAREEAVLSRAREDYGEYAADVLRTIMRHSRRQQEKLLGSDEQSIFDISRELFSAPVYPDDSVPEKERVRSMEDGSEYNLTNISMCVHNGTHIDSPLHFIADGGDVCSLPDDAAVGRCLVADYDHDLNAADVEALPYGVERLLLRGGHCCAADGAEAAVKAGIRLIGTDMNSVGDGEVHRILLGGGVVPLELLDLSGVQPGEYILIAQPLRLAGCEGAPCRAMLYRE